MLATAVGGLGESLVAWVWAPALLLALGIGLGLLAERAVRVTLPAPALAPLGACAAIVAVMPVYRLGLGGWYALALAGSLAGAGWWLGRAGLRARLRPGPAAWAALGAYLLFLAPVLLVGGWTWTGYNFVNDTAVQMVLADRLLHAGATLPVSGSAAIADSAYLEYVRVYLVTHYPLGSHSLLATLARGTPAPLAAIYQPFAALLAALTTLALASLARRDLPGPRAAALVALGALASNLVYVYALQGNVKELALLMTLAAAAAVGRQALDGPRPVATVALVAVCLAAALHVYSAAAIPYLGLFALALALAALVVRAGTLRRRMPRALAVGTAVFAVAGAVTIDSVVAFGEVAQGTFAGAKAASGGTDDLGQLLRPLKFGQVSGVWLGEDYRVPVPPGRQGANRLLIGLSFALAIAGLALLVARRRVGVLLYALPVLGVIPLVAPRVSSYAAGKTFAIGSSGSLLLAGAALAIAWPLLGRWRRWAPALAAALAATLGAGVLLSDAYAYRATQLAPIDRMQAMAEVGRRLAGRRVLDNEYEEFAKVFMPDVRLDVALETISPQPLYNQLALATLDRRAELDQLPLGPLQAYPYLVQRRGADMARAPAGYELDFENRYYRVWRRASQRTAVASVPLASLYEAGGVPACDALAGLAAQARPGDRVVAATLPGEVRVDVARLPHPPGWTAHPYIPDVLVLATPGRFRATARFPAGRYEAWVQGSSGRPLELRVDGRRVGAPQAIETRGGWLDAGAVRLAAGRHAVELLRPGGSLAPGDKAVSWVGPIVFRRTDEPVRLVDVAPRQATKRLCGRRWDWVELVRRAGPGERS